MFSIKSKKIQAVCIFIIYNFFHNLFCFAIDTQFDNPWLYLKAIQESYPDIAGGFFFDSEANDWCIKIGNTHLYWAAGRLLPKNSAAKWQNWGPFFSYFYPETVPDPKYYPESLVEALKPDSLIKHRRSAPAPNYTFYALIYKGWTKREIIRQLKKIKFFGIEIEVHNRIADALTRIEKKILTLQKNSPEIRFFIKNIGASWGFNWRVIADSGKLSNHSWGTAVDILPINYRNKKIYWLWEAAGNDNWMKILPYKRWNPPDAVIKIFEDEGFIWGGKWDLWDNMHFEYRPELLYVRDFILSQNPDKFSKTTPDAGAHLPEESGAPNIPVKSGTPSNIFKAVTELAETVAQLHYFIEEMQYKYESAIEFFKEDLKAEEGANEPVQEYTETEMPEEE